MNSLNYHPNLPKKEKELAWRYVLKSLPGWGGIQGGV
jgi:hypothetical protein